MVHDLVLAERVAEGLPGVLGLLRTNTDQKESGTKTRNALFFSSDLQCRDGLPCKRLAAAWLQISGFLFVPFWPGPRAYLFLLSFAGTNYGELDAKKANLHERNHELLASG